MRSGCRLTGWAAAIAGAALVFACGCVSSRPVSLHGAVLRQDGDSTKQSPVAGVQVTASVDGVAAGEGKSDSTGLFHVTLAPGIKLDQPVTLHFRRKDYLPLDWDITAGDNLYIVRLSPVPLVHAEPPAPEVRVQNISVRYTTKGTAVIEVGTGVKIFQVVNVGNVPCNGRPPCSPDGKWKAAIGSATLEAGEGNEFRNARVSCIAGPCPFTRLESDGFSRGGSRISVAERNWSDTTTFLLEAERFHPMVSDHVRKSYPVIFGQEMNFTVPQSAEGVSLEAEINGAAVIFPLGPNLFLSWAECTVQLDTDQSKLYRCEPKPGFRFQ